MGRENCLMCTVIGNDVFCGYYDVGFMTCSEIPFSTCPAGLDNDDYYNESDDAQQDLDTHGRDDMNGNCGK